MGYYDPQNRMEIITCQKKCLEFHHRGREILVVVEQQIFEAFLQITVTKDEDRPWDVLQN